MNARLIKTDHPADHTLGFVIEVDEPFEFRAGQSCDLTLVNPPHEDGKGSTRTFSITSAPNEAPRLMFATRQTGSAFKRSLEDGPLGMAIEVDGPWGSFVLHDDAARPAVLLAGGIGITPFRSMIKDAVERRLAHAITLLYSNRTQSSAAFFSDFVTWSHVKRNFTFVPTLTDPPADGITVTFAGRSSSRAIGDAMATWVLSKKGKASNVLLVHSSSFPTLGDVKDGFEGRYKALCSACKETVLDEPATAIGKDLPQNVAAKLRSDSSINYVVAEEGNMLLGLPEALKAAGINVPVIGQYPSETSIQYLKDGSIVKAIVMTQQVDSMFQATDALARAFAGQDFQADQPASPTWIVTPSPAARASSTIGCTVR